jgi:hypothetical protein
MNEIYWMQYNPKTRERCSSAIKILADEETDGEGKQWMRMGCKGRYYGKWICRLKRRRRRPHNQDDEETMRFSKEKSSLSGFGGHKRSLSGSILSKLSFLRPNQGDSEPLPQLPQTDGTGETGSLQRNGGGAMTAVVQQQKKLGKGKDR